MVHSEMHIASYRLHGAKKFRLIFYYYFFFFLQTCKFCSQCSQETVSSTPQAKREQKPLHSKHDADCAVSS